MLRTACLALPAGSAFWAAARADTPRQVQGVAALGRAGQNRTEAARILGIGEATLYRRLREAQHEHVS